MRGHRRCEWNNQVRNRVSEKIITTIVLTCRSRVISGSWILIVPWLIRILTQAEIVAAFGSTCRQKRLLSLSREVVTMLDNAREVSGSSPEDDLFATY